MQLLRVGSSGQAVRRLQTDLNRHGYKLVVDGSFGGATQRAVISFQTKNNLVPDGVVGDRTWSALEKREVGKDCSIELRLTAKDIVDASAKYKIPYPVLAAISEKESRGFGFTDDNKPKVLFERHWMRNKLNEFGLDICAEVSQAGRPDLCSSQRGGYLGGKREYQRLLMAMRIHPDAAMEAASYGRFQIMGFHWKRLGYKSVKEYFDSAHASEREHLEHFCKFVTSDKRLHRAMQVRDLETIALLYNGPKHAENNYVNDLAALISKYE